MLQVLKVGTLIWDRTNLEAFTFYLLLNRVHSNVSPNDVNWLLFYSCLKQPVLKIPVDLSNPITNNGRKQKGSDSLCLHLNFYV